MIIMSITHTVNHDGMLWIMNDANLSFNDLWLAETAADVAWQLPQGAALLQNVAWEIQRG